MLTRRALLTAGALLLSVSAAPAQEKLKAIATFSILADFVHNVGGDRVEVQALVGPNSDAHVYQPSPSDAKALADAKVIFTNGLGFEGWIARLIKASGTKAAMIVATKGVNPRKADDGHGHADADPHAWQSVANAKIYVMNIRDALAAGRCGRQKHLRDERRRLSRKARRDRCRGEGRGRENPGRPAPHHHHPRRVRLFRRDLRGRLHRAARRIDGVRGLSQGRRQDHHPDQEAEDSGGVSWRTSPTTGCSSASGPRPARGSAARSIPTR
jgi:hypothetical protein